MRQRELGQVVNRNFVRSVLAEGGQIKPLILPASDTKGLGLCNPSVFIDNGEIWTTIRNVNYTIYHCENGQTFNNRWGCMSYLNPENDLHLRTTNFLCKLTPDLDIEKYWKIDTSALDKDPLWEFVGLEDARLVRWDGHLYGIGVRRDTTTNGQGRMEFSELKVSDKGVSEIRRWRIEHPVNPDWYCEKNWMPVTDMPYHFIKWANPAELVVADLDTLKSRRAIEVDESDKREGFGFLRGNSQVIPWKNYHICLVHESDLFWNRIGQKDAMYMHRFVVYDPDWHIVNIGPLFSFLGGELEFVCGMAEWEKDLLITFGWQDNAAFILRVPEHMVRRTLGGDRPDWGLFAENKPAMDYLQEEVITRRIYEIPFGVEEGDIVLDLGASVGPFVWSLKDKKPKRVIAVEPDQRFHKTLTRNSILTENVTIVKKGIADTDGKVITRGLYSGKEFYNDTWEGDPEEMDGITFKTLIKENNIDRIDFIKTDCEGGEYDVFNDENFDWIKQNVRKVSGEFHLHTKELNSKWMHFRDTYLKHFKFSVSSIDGVWINPSEVWREWFALNYKAVMLYIDNREEKKWAATPFPAIEVTTAVPLNGCPMKCAFCPQDKLAVAYKGVQTLSYENFVKLADKIPREVQISFSGFCEPFLNPGCSAMIAHAHKTGHKVSVFTTGIGMKPDDLDRIKEIPFTGIQGGFVLHLPDTEGYFAYDQSNGYTDILRSISEAEICNFEAMTMGTLPDPLRELFPNTILRTIYNRAGNLDRPEAIRTDKKESPTTCGCQEKLYHNVLMPNGDVVLCCQDFGLSHVLGNLYRQSYVEIVPEDRTAFELCKSCENGVPA